MKRRPLLTKLNKLNKEEGDGQRVLPSVVLLVAKTTLLSPPTGVHKTEGCRQGCKVGE
jgi:hypothetical protein